MVEFVERFEHTSPPPEREPSEQPDAIAARTLLGSLEARAAAVWQLAPAAPAPPAASEASAASEAEAASAAGAAGVAEVRRGLERYVMERLHPRVFGMGMDVVEDKVLQAQVATLSFVTPAHFGLLAEACEGTCWEAALAALRRMGSVKAPLDKVACVVETVAQLGTITDPCDASFVRLFALAVLRARPAQLYSQLEYIARFVHQDTLWSPEAGGPFSIARAAVQYLAHLDPMGLGRGAAAVAER